MLPQFKKDFLEKISSDEMLKFNELWASVERHGLTFEVIHTALEEMKSNQATGNS